MQYRRDKHTEWIFWVIFFSGMAIFLGIIVLILRIEYEKAVNLRSHELSVPKECICYCAGSTIVDDGHGRGDMKQLEVEVDRWRAVTEEYHGLLVRSGILRITGEQAEGKQDTRS